MAKSPRKSAAKAAKPATPSFIQMVVKAIGQCHGGAKGASRASIANWIQKNYNKEAGAGFNAHLRKALKNGVDNGTLKQGSTDQRYKLGEGAKAVQKSMQPKKKKPAKKPKSAKKKKVSKKKSSAKKKKVTKKKKSGASKKSPKKKAAKKSPRKSAKKSPRKSAAKKKSSKKSPKSKK